jgi:iron complex outermembrane receptor protein
MKPNIFLSSLFISSTLLAQNSTDALFELSLEELLDITVSSVTRQEEDSFKSTAAISVLSSEDIRRSGATNIPELLEMIPGFHVGQLTSNMFAINARGNNNHFARQLLVMIDGRNVYSPTVNNVYWDQIDLIMEDIKRVEIIRGPGSSLWGSNAANGIINIVTKNTQDTQGFFTSIQAATSHLKYDLSTRYGYNLKSSSGRVYAKQTHLDRSIYPSLEKQSKNGRTTPLDEAYDGKIQSQIGYRHDSYLSDTVTLMFNAQYQTLRTEEVKTFFNPAQETFYKQDGGYMLSLLDISHSSTSNSKLQFYIDYFNRDNAKIEDKKIVYDIDYQNNFEISNLKSIWGIGFRHLEHSYHNQSTFYGNAMSPNNISLNYYSSFIQLSYPFFNEIIEITAGSKYENNPYSGNEFMPTLRLGIYPNEKNTIWVSATKTVSTPSRQTADGYLDISSITGTDECLQFGGTVDPVLGCSAGVSNNISSSYMHVYEMGYKLKLSHDILIDNALFYNQYQRHNDETDKFNYVAGYEFTIKYLLNQDTTLNAYYTFHEGENLETLTISAIEGLPRNTFAFRGNYNFTDAAELDLFYRHQTPHDRARELNQLNIRFGYHFHSGIETSILLSNLLQKNHVESNTDSTRANSYIQRSALIKALSTLMVENNKLKNIVLQ